MGRRQGASKQQKEEYCTERDELASVPPSVVTADRELVGIAGGKPVWR
jgi:hypothetical protein